MVEVAASKALGSPGRAGEGNALGLWREFFGFAVRFLRRKVSAFRMFQCLSGHLVSSEVIFFAVVDGGSAVCVRGEFVKFSCSLVRIICHRSPQS
jgi:hypothetical protein